MNGGSPIYTLHAGRARAGAGPNGPAGRVVELSQTDIYESPPMPTPPPPSPIPADPDDGAAVPLRTVGMAVLATLVIVAAAGWTGAALWLARGWLPSLSPVEGIEFAAALATIPALLGIVYLVALRSSRAEARRFGATARAMRAEAAALERSVAMLAGALEENRMRLADQSSAMLAMGDETAARLGTLADSVAAEVARAAAQASALAGAGSTAQSTLADLVAALPRAQASTDAMAQRLEQVTETVDARAARLEDRLTALAAQGELAGEATGAAAALLAEHLTRMETTSEVAGGRLEAVTAEMAGAVDVLLGRTADAIDRSRQALTEQGEAMMAMVTANQSALDAATRDGAAAVADRVASVEGAIDRIAARLGEQRQAGDALVAGLDAGIAGLDAQFAALEQQGSERAQRLAQSISALGGSADAMRESLRSGEGIATQTIATAESLLIALDAATREIDETLPDALARLDRRIGQSQAVVGQAKPELLALVTAAESTHEAIEAIAGVIAEQRRVLDELSSALITTLDDGRDKADAIGEMVEETIGRTHRFSEEAAPRLVDALLRVRETATVAAERARETLATVIPEAADKLEAASAEAMRRAAGDTVQRQLRSLGDTADEAVAVAARATERLAARLQEVSEQSALLDTRIDDARAEREEADRDNLSRRVSLLIEALNSASIDITKSFAPDIADSAWAAYLKGDRGVFTRRAVRIVDGNDAREIARLYDADDRVREQINRYIHDFEAMLRLILAQRDGSPLGITLLSSDMGKLYVALAQAIERLR